MSKQTYSRAEPILSSKNIPATIFAETAPINEGKSWALTYDELKELQDNNHWEVGSHSVNHPYLTQTSDDILNFELNQSKTDLEGHGLTVESFSAPYGDFDRRVLSNIAKYYKYHRITRGIHNGYPYNDYIINAYTIYNTTSPADVRTWVEEAMRDNKWLVLTFHGLTDEPSTNPNDYTVSDFQKVVDIVAESGIRASTFSANLNRNAANMLNNGSFEELVNGWANGWSRTNPANVSIDEENHGSFTTYMNSLKIAGAFEKNEVVSDKINIDPAKTYIVKFYENMQDYEAGMGGVFIDEFGEQGNYVSGRWLGIISNKYVGTRSFTYSPAANVSKIDLEFYTNALSDFSLFIDRVSITELDSLPPELIIESPQDNQAVKATIDIKAEIDDSPNGNSNISGATYMVDNGSPVRMIAGDGNFDSSNENVTASLDTRTLTDGYHSLKITGLDAEDNEVNALRTIKVDNTAPVTSFIITPSSYNGQNGWYKTVPLITLTPDETARTEYQWDSASGSWATYLENFKALKGTHTLYYRSIDELGNTEIIKAQGAQAGSRIMVDDYKPKTQALYKVKIKKGAYAKLYWKVGDPYTADKAYVTLKLQKRYGKIYKTIKYVRYKWTRINKTRYYKRRFNGQGVYKYLVYAKDQAGNKQRNIARNYIIVKS